MDTQSSLYQRSGINLGDCSIMIKGNKDKDNVNTNVKFYINSGKIHDIRCTESSGKVSSPAILLVGNIVDDNVNRKAKNCQLNMYGGYIKSEKGTQYVTGDVAFKCIQPRGKGAVVNLVYGDLESFHYCISGQGLEQGASQEARIKEVDKYGDTEINIYGGTFNGGKGDGDEINYDNTYTTLFFPQSGTVNIYGGNFTGPSCIDAKAGNLNIYGGTFNAVRNYNASAKAGTNGSEADGSVIFAECNNAYSGVNKYPLKIVVNFATMISKNGYIFKCSGHKADFIQEYPKVDATFESGNFVYKIDKHSNDDVNIPLTCNINGGTWVKE